MGGLWLLSQPTRFKNATISAMWISVKLATNVAMTENVSKRPRRPKKSATVNAETQVKPAMMSAETHLSMKKKNAEMTVNVRKMLRRKIMNVIMNATRSRCSTASNVVTTTLSTKKKNAATMPSASNRRNDTTKNVTKNATTTDLPDHLTRKRPLSKSAALMVATKKPKPPKKNVMAMRTV